MVFKKTLSLSKISTGIKFSNEISNGYGEFNIAYHSDVLTDVIIGDVIKVYKGATIIYFWKVTNKTVTLASTGIVQDIDCKGYQTILNDFYYSSGGVYAFTKNLDPNAILQDILGQSDQELAYFSVDYSNMNNVGTSSNIEFDKSTLNDAIKKVLATTSFYYAIRADGKAYFQALPVTSSHNLEFGKDIRSIVIDYNGDEITNDITLYYDGGWTLTDTDTASKYLYGTKQKLITETSIQNSWTANAYTDSYFLDKALERDTIKVIVNTSYSIETFYPWQMINISNCPIEIKEKIIKRVEFTDKGATLYLNTKETIEKSLYKLIS
jgi:hypothetical protein